MSNQSLNSDSKWLSEISMRLQLSGHITESKRFVKGICNKINNKILYSVQSDSTIRQERKVQFLVARLQSICNIFSFMNISEKKTYYILLYYQEEHKDYWTNQRHRKTSKNITSVTVSSLIHKQKNMPQCCQECTQCCFLSHCRSSTIEISNIS